MSDADTPVGMTPQLAVVLVVSLAVAIPAMLIGVPTETTIESGLLLGLAMATFPPIFYKASGSPEYGLGTAGLWGASNAAVCYLLYVWGYALLAWGGLAGSAGEVATFVAVSVVYFGVGSVVDRHGLPGRSTDGVETG